MTFEGAIIGNTAGVDVGWPDDPKSLKGYHTEDSAPIFKAAGRHVCVLSLRIRRRG